MEQKTYNICIVVTELLLWGVVWFGIFTGEALLIEQQKNYEKLIQVKMDSTLYNLDRLKE